MIVQTACTVFQQNLLSGAENFTLTSPNTYKIALYTALANLNNQTQTYSTVNEVSGAGYTPGGQVLVISTPVLQDTTNNVSYVSFQNVVWNPASFTCRGALVYNASTLAACFVLNFGSDKICTNSFTITFPAATSSSAILTIGSFTTTNPNSSGD